MVEPNVVRLSSKDGEKARLVAEKRIRDGEARLLRVRKRLKDYLRA